MTTEHIDAPSSADDVTPSQLGIQRNAKEDLSPEDYGAEIVDDSLGVDDPNAGSEDAAGTDDFDAGAEEDAADEPAPNDGEEYQAEDISPRVYSAEEYSKANSKWDSALQQERNARAAAEKEATSLRTNQNAAADAKAESDAYAEASAYAAQIRDHLVNESGLDEETASTLANQQAGAIYEAWKSNRTAAQIKTEADGIRSEAQTTAIRTRKESIAAEYGLKPSDLDEFNSFAQMEKYAQAAGPLKPKRRAPRTPTGGEVPGNTSPRNIDAMIDRYNNGLMDEDDPSYPAVAKALGF